MVNRRMLPGLLIAATAACQRRVAAGDATGGFTFPGPVLPPGYWSRFRTAGNAIVDDNSQIRTFHGVAVPDVLWIAQRNDAGIGYFDERLFRTAWLWHANIMRLSIAPALFRRHGSAATLQALDASVAFARKYGLYLIINLHTIGFPPDNTYRSLVDWQYGELYRTDDAEIARFWTLMARHYRHEKVIAFYELVNEPVRILPDGGFDYDSSEASWTKWRDYAERLIDTLRAHDPDKAVIVGGLEFAYDLSHAAAIPVRRPNVVYATHPYAGANWKRSWDEAFLRAATQVPVFATEFGWGDAHPEASDKASGRYREAILAAFDAAGISWTAWSMSHTFAPSLLANPDFTATTEYGTVVREALARHAP